MTVDPDPIAERTTTVEESDLKMKDATEAKVENAAVIDPKLEEEFDL